MYLSSFVMCTPAGTINGGAAETKYNGTADY